MTILAVLLGLVFGLLLYKRIYFKPLTCLRINSDHSIYVSLFKPSKRSFRQLGAGYRIGCVVVKPGIAVLFVDNPSLPLNFCVNGVNVYGDSIVLSKGFKFKSIDLSDRPLNDFISTI